MNFDSFEWSIVFALFTIAFFIEMVGLMNVQAKVLKADASYDCLKSTNGFGDLSEIEQSTDLNDNGYMDCLLNGSVVYTRTRVPFLELV